MKTPADPAGGAPPPPATPPPAAPPAAPPPADPPEPNWLPQRLEQAERAGERRALEKLGVKADDLDAAKKTLEDARAAAEAQKGWERRAGEHEASAKAAQTRAEQAEAINKEHAARMMGVLSEDKQTAVKAIAGDDAGLQLKAIHALGPTWAAEAERAGKAGKAAAPPPANTAPPPDAPGGTDPASPPDHRAVYQTLNDNPFARAAYGSAHPEAYKARN